MFYNPGARYYRKLSLTLLLEAKHLKVSICLPVHSSVNLWMQYAFAYIQRMQFVLPGVGSCAAFQMVLLLYNVDAVDVFLYMYVFFEDFCWT